MADTSESSGKREAILLPVPVPVPVLIIAAQRQCFERALRVASAAGITGVIEHVAASFVSSDDVLGRCCPKGFCGHGQRLKPGARAVMDGGMQAHRRAWARVLQLGTPSIVLEDDIRLIGSSDDISFSIAQCARANCSLAYLGASFDMLLSHAYYLTPHAARSLLDHSSEWCNVHKQDWVIRWACIQPGSARLRCHRPPRGRYVSMKTDWGRGALGWGIFIQDHAAVPSFTVAVGMQRAFDKLNASRLSRIVSGRCATITANWTAMISPATSSE
jgi:hypothetical protein